jgi:hypothetical protein
MAASQVLSIFYGYPAETISKWCGVSVNTANAYKAGRRRPSAAVTRLFMLHRERRVLGPAWRGWVVKHDSIVDPDGNETSRSQLHNYFWIVQFARHLAGEHGEETHREFYRLLGGDG